LKSSASLSATPTSPSPSGPPRKSFALAGHSVALDPRINAVRRDLADVRLAGQVFAPHYASPMPMEVAIEVMLREGPEGNSSRMALLQPHEIFEVLELAGDNAWGIALEHGLVGYVNADALVRPAP
jgi:hypothetical protein